VDLTKAIDLTKNLLLKGGRSGRVNLPSYSTYSLGQNLPFVGEKHRQDPEA